MSYESKIKRKIRLYMQGVYSLREFLPHLVITTSNENLKDLIPLLEGKLKREFQNWVHDFTPGEGVILKCGESLASQLDEKMRILKSITNSDNLM